MSFNICGSFGAILFGPILACITNQEHEPPRRKERIFRFVDYLSHDPDLNFILPQTWRTRGSDFDSRLKKTREMMKKFKEGKGSLRRDIELLSRRLERAQGWDSSEENVIQRRAMERDLSDLLQKQEVY